MWASLLALARFIPGLVTLIEKLAELYATNKKEQREAGAQARLDTKNAAVDAAIAGVGRLSNNQLPKQSGADQPAGFLSGRVGSPGVDKGGSQDHQSFGAPTRESLTMVMSPTDSPEWIDAKRHLSRYEDYLMTAYREKRLGWEDYQDLMAPVYASTLELARYGKTEQLRKKILAIETPKLPLV